MLRAKATNQMIDLESTYHSRERSVNTPSEFIEHPLDRLKAFPSTRYFGSKRHQLPWMYGCLEGIDFYTVLDAFGGTSSASLLFKAMNKSVTFNDGFCFNVVGARALLSNVESQLQKNELVMLLKSVKSRRGFISKTFSGLYFTDAENEWLDGLMCQLAPIVGSAKYDVIMYCLFQACLQKRPFNLFHRANLYLRTASSVKRSFGNLTTWNTPFSDHMLRAFDEYRECSWNSRISQRVLAPNSAEFLGSGYDLVYLDPPYFKLNSHTESYGLRYHFLEGLCEYDSWHSKIDYATKTKRLKDGAYFSAWNERSSFKHQLFQLVETHRNSIVVLSYVANAFPSVSELRSVFRKNFQKYQVKKMVYKQALSKQGREELLFIGHPRKS
jgi:adenine-specific DNA-methyltransferase